jgi:hypothetical protein
MTSATKAGPLSDPMEMGIPYLGVISFSEAWITSWAFFVQVGKTSTHPEKVQSPEGIYSPWFEGLFPSLQEETTHILDSQFREWLLSGIIFGTCFTLLARLVRWGK